LLDLSNYAANARSPKLHDPVSDAAGKVLMESIIETKKNACANRDAR
jgi:hypothetical protein